MFSFRSGFVRRCAPLVKSMSLHSSSARFTPGFRGLIEDISTLLSPYSGFNAAEIDHQPLLQRLAEYESSSQEWSPYAFADFSLNYTRNLVDRGNGKANLLLLVWSPGKGSAVHDHTDSHCIMKVLQGTLKETLYDWPGARRDDSAPLQVRRETLLRENNATYMSDKLGLHKISNADPHRPAVSLHLYTPPWAEKRGCHVFEEKTGKACHVLPGLFSEFGSRV